MVVNVPRESVGGEDFLNLSMWCEFRPISQYEATLGVLASAKRSAKDPSAKVEDRIRKFKNESFEVAATGAMHGGLRTDYRLQCRGITICLRIDGDGQGGLPNVMVHVGSSMLMSEGIERCYDLVKHLVEHCLGGKILRESISRVDFCADLPGVDVGDLAKLVMDRQFVSRLRGVKFWGDDKGWSGFGIGKGPIQLRCYCKAEELKAKEDPEKAAIVKQWRWGGIEFYDFFAPFAQSALEYLPDNVLVFAVELWSAASIANLWMPVIEVIAMAVLYYTFLGIFVLIKFVLKLVPTVG